MRTQIKIAFLAAALVTCLSPAENSVELSLSGLPKPGESAYFHVSNNANGVSSQGGGLLSHAYTGYYKFSLNGEGSVGSFDNSLTGRLASSLNQTRLGFSVDSFILLRSFFDERLMHVLTSGVCPGSSGFNSAGLDGKNFNWLFVRTRAKDAIRGRQDATIDNFAGTFTLNTSSSSMVTGSQVVTLSNPGAASSAAGYNLNTNANLLCSGGGQVLIKSNANAPWDSRTRLYFGKNAVLGMSGGLYSADPLIMVAVPQQPLNDSLMVDGNNSVAKNAFVTLYTNPDSSSNPVLKEVAVLPNSTATSFTLKDLADVNDSKSGLSLGTITCPKSNWNVPFPGACNGTFSMGGMSANSICMFSQMDSQILMACVAQVPQDNSKSVSIVGTFPTKATLIVDAPVFTPTDTKKNCATMKITNPTPRFIPTIAAGGNPDSAKAYWDSGAFNGANGQCGSSVAPFSSCESVVCAKLGNGDPDRAKKYLFQVSYSEDGQAPTVAASDYSAVVQVPDNVSIKPKTFSCGSFPSVQYVDITAKYADGTQTGMNGVVSSKNLLKIEKSGVDIEIFKDSNGLQAVRLNSMPSASGAARLVVTLGGVPYSKDLELCGSKRTLLMKGLTSIPSVTMESFRGYLRSCSEHYMSVRQMINQDLESGGTCSDLNNDLAALNSNSCGTSFMSSVDTLNSLLSQFRSRPGVLRAAMLDMKMLKLLSMLTRRVFAGSGTLAPIVTSGADHDLVSTSDANTKIAVALYGQLVWLCNKYPSSSLADVQTVVDTSKGVLGLR